MSARLPLTLFLTFFLVLIYLFLLITPALAQVGGTGAEVIRPVEKLWQFSRNISYLLLTIVLIVTGVMIMLRSRINPQTVVGLQQALPGIIIALVVITFSYFIVSVIIDLAFILAQVIGIVIMMGLHTSPFTINDAQDIVGKVLNNRNILDLMSKFVINPGLFVAANAIGNSVIKPIIEVVPILGDIPILGNIIAFILGTPLAAIFLISAMLTAFFQLFLGLITAYTMIILNVIFAPFLIMFSAVPGRGGNLGNWIRGLLGNVLIFPAVFGAFVLVAALLDYNDPWLFSGAFGSFDQPLPLFAGFDNNFIRYILAYGIILASAGIPDFIKNLIGAQTPAQLGQAVGAASGAGQTTATGAYRWALGKIGKVGKGP